MINIPSIIERINVLLHEDSDASITYAALEARLGLEKICYDRLRQRHAYISHDQLRRWQPGAVVNTLIADVDQHLGQTVTLSIGSPASAGIELKNDEYVEVGTEVGFDTKRIVKMWNALAKLALHVHLPEHQDDQIPAYGNRAQIRAKVEEVVAELQRLAKGTMIFSGLGPEVSFDCVCGEKNKRRAALLREGQHIYCINPNCDYTWKVIKEQDEFGFESVTVPVNCDRCTVENSIPWRFVTRMKYDQLGSFPCHTCGHKNHVKWHLMQTRQGRPGGGAI